MGSQKKQSFSSKMGAGETLFMVVFVFMAVGSVVLPRSTGTRPVAKLVETESVVLSWEENEKCVVKAAGKCEYQLFVRSNDGAHHKPEDWKKIGEAKTYDSVYITHRVQGLTPGKVYRFRARNTAYQFEDGKHTLKWGEYSPESKPILTKPLVKQTVGVNAAHSNESKTSSDTLAKNSKGFLARFTGWVHGSLQVSTMALFVFFVVFLFRTDTIYLLSYILDRAFAIPKTIWLMNCLLVGVVSWFFGDELVRFNGKVRGTVDFFQRSFLILTCAVLLLAAVILGCLLWWRCQRFKWPLLQSGPFFFTTLSFLSAAMIRFTLPRLSGGLSLVLTSDSGANFTLLAVIYVLWVLMILVLLLLTVMIDLVFLSSSKTARIFAPYEQGKTSGGKLRKGVLALITGIPNPSN